MSQAIHWSDKTTSQRFGEHRSAVEKILKNNHQVQPTAVPEHFALTGHSINDLQITPLELINSNRDMIRKARQSYLITIANTLESYGMSRRDKI